MSYCRFSSDDFRSDVYAYEHCDGGFVVHVARLRHVAETPIPPLPAEWWAVPVEELIAARKAQAAWPEAARMEPIGLPHDGETYCEADAGACADRLEALRAVGYRVPQFAIDALRSEAVDQQA